MLSAGVPATRVEAQFDAPGPGTVLAFATGGVYCTAAECPVPAGPTPPTGGVWLSAVDSETMPPATTSWVILTPDQLESVSVHGVSKVTGAGPVTRYLRAIDPPSGNYFLYDISMTLVFLPD